MAKKKIKLVFVDVDGVINSSRTVTVVGGYPFPMTKAGKDGQVFEDPPLRLGDAIDKVAVGLIAKAVYENNAYIVWSTSWRIGLGLQGCKEMGEIFGFGSERILGRTFSLSGPDSRRGTEIRHFMWCLESKAVGCSPKNLIDQGYLDEKLARQIDPNLDFEVEHYAIIDDNSDMLPEQKPFFVQTNPDNGFSYRNYVQLSNLMTGWEKDTGARFLPEDDLPEDYEVN